MAKSVRPFRVISGLLAGIVPQCWPREGGLQPARAPAPRLAYATLALPLSAGGDAATIAELVLRLETVGAP